MQVDCRQPIDPCHILGTDLHSKLEDRLMSVKPCKGVKAGLRGMGMEA